MPRKNLLEGRPEPMGASVVADGVNFVVFSEHAQRIELCVFDDSGTEEHFRADLHGPHDGLFHGLLPGAGAGLVYGLRAHGPYNPEAGHRFNAHKLLLDPYARDIVGRFEWRPEHSGYILGDPDGPLSFEALDNAGTALKARVVAPRRAGDRPPRPRIATADMVLCETHVKGFSRLHPAIPREMRGTYAGLAHEAAIAHFKSLGITTLSLLPVQYSLSEPGLAARGAANYWGYNTLGFFAADPRLSMTPWDGAAANEEFRRMVDALHAAGLEVVIDVVYNHTAEGNELGPTLSFRGLDNASWYRLEHDDRQRCENFSGCGNTLHVAHPRVMQFVLDSLRHWVDDMGVDGFRFDLAPVLGRTHGGFHTHAAFFTALLQDPTLSSVHLIAEPWDAGLGGYQLGHFPGRFQEWNDKFRDAVRGYWLGHRVTRGEIARRMLGSADVFHHRQRQPTASVNYITAHDGFTLRDLTSYSRKHNHANGEDNRDGRDDEPCANFGHEGDTDDELILTRRRRAARAMMSTLLLAQGTPMICAGDELGRTQQGNNNAYCQDNGISWHDWGDVDAALRDMVAELLALRAAEPLLRSARWFQRCSGFGNSATAAWRMPAGHDVNDGEWHDPHANTVACLLSPPAAHPGARLFVALNPCAHTVDFVLPPGRWELAFDSTQRATAGTASRRDLLVAPAVSVVVLRESAATPSLAEHSPS